MLVTSPGIGAMMTCRAWSAMKMRGGQDPPLAQRLLEEALVTVEPDHEPVRRGVSEDEPDAGTDDDSGDGSRDDAPAAPGDQLRPPVMADECGTRWPPVALHIPDARPMRRQHV